MGFFFCWHDCYDAYGVGQQCWPCRQLVERPCSQQYRGRGRGHLRFVSRPLKSFHLSSPSSASSAIVAISASRVRKSTVGIRRRPPSAAHTHTAACGGLIILAGAAFERSLRADPIDGARGLGQWVPVLRIVVDVVLVRLGPHAGGRPDRHRWTHANRAALLLAPGPMSIPHRGGAVKLLRPRGPVWDGVGWLSEPQQCRAVPSSRARGGVAIPSPPDSHSFAYQRSTMPYAEHNLPHRGWAGARTARLHARPCYATERGIRDEDRVREG